MRLLSPTRRIAATAGVALLLGASLSGCSVLKSVLPADKPERAESGEVIQEGTGSAFDLKVGDCVSDTEGTTVSDLPVLPCSQEHADEVFYAFELEPGDFPGDEAINAIADERCIAEFTGYVGSAYEESELTYWPMTPSAPGWESLDDREVLCMVYDESGPLTASVKGSNR